MEGLNVRYLRLRGAHLDPQGTATAGPTAGAAELPEPVSLATVDVAFISLRLVLPPIVGVVAPGGDVVALVKPQFEAGPADVGKGGVVRDVQVHRRVLEEVLGAARRAGVTPLGVTASPIRGEAGNVEFLLWARRAPGEAPQAQAPQAQAPQAPVPGAPPFDDEMAVTAALAEAGELPPGRGRG